MSEKIMVENIGDLSKLTATITLSALLLGISYNYGLFLRIGTHWISILKIEDHIATALEWLPLTIIMHLCVYIFGANIHRSKRRTEANSSKPYARQNWFVKNYRFIRLACVLMSTATSAAMAFLFHDKWWIALIMFALFVSFWWGMSSLITDTSNTFTFSAPTSSAILIIPLILALTCTIGYLEGHRRVKKEDGVLSIEIEGNRNLTGLNRIYILTAGVLAQDLQCDCIVFVPNGAIRKIRSL